MIPDDFNLVPEILFVVTGSRRPETGLIFNLVPEILFVVTSNSSRRGSSKALKFQSRSRDSLRCDPSQTAAPHHLL